MLVFTSAGLGAYFTWRQVRHNREQLEATREQLEVARRQAEDSDRHAREQLEVARRGQVTKRFTRAIDQLGSDQLDIRLGGIYALERIGRDSDADRPTIAEILTAYICQRSPWPPTQPGQYKPDWPLDHQPDLRTRAPDVQAALPTWRGQTSPTRICRGQWQTTPRTGRMGSNGRPPASVMSQDIGITPNPQLGSG